MTGIVKGIGGAINTLLGGGQPSVPEAKTAPVADDKTARRAREKSTARKYAGAGRAGTMLSGDESKLG